MRPQDDKQCRLSLIHILRPQLHASDACRRRNRATGGAGGFLRRGTHHARGSGAKVYYAGVKEQGGQLYTSGGRVVGVTQTAGTLAQAIQGAYVCAQQIQFENRYCRSDIGARALQAEGTV